MSAGGCDGSCSGQWAVGSGFVQPRQEAAFGAWHDGAMSTFDQIMLFVSVISAALVLARRPSRGCSPSSPSGQLCHPELALLEAVALLGPGTLLLLLRLKNLDLWTAKREQICVAAKLAALVLRCAVGILLGAAPAAAAAAASARGSLPLPGPAAGPALRVVWLCSAAFSAMALKVRLQSQLLVSAAALALAAAAAAHDALLAPLPTPAHACAALLCAVGAEALHFAVIYVWDAHLRAAFLAGGGDGGGAAAHRAGGKRPAGKAKAA